MPRSERPHMPGYGVPDTDDGLLAWSWADERLVAERSYWVVTASAAGRPHAMPVWGMWNSAEEAFWFSCSNDARKARNLAENPQITITTDNTREVVSVEGTAQRVSDTERLEPAVTAFVAKYAHEMPSDDSTDPAEQLAAFMAETAFHRVTPERAFGLIETPEDFGPAATRWVW